MRRKTRWGLAVLAALLCWLGTAGAQQAMDITTSCLYNGQKGSSIRDDSYRTVWTSSRKNGCHALAVEAPAGQAIGGLLVRWHQTPMALRVETRNEAGDWELHSECDADFLAQYIAVGSASAVRIMERDSVGKRQLQISSVTVLTPGETPPDVQLWRKPPQKVDLMLLSAHPDDEVLWFGGLLPYYSVARNREVLVINTSYSREDRRLELLDCLWTCGVRSYPVFLGYPDICTNQPDKVLTRWKWDDLLGDVTALYRRYRPDVVVLHGEEGEYGHGVHRLISRAGREAADAAADESRYEQSAQAFGLWEVPKIYMHLHSENQLRMNWHEALDCFDGKSSFEMAKLGFQCHRSQQNEWQMTDGGPYDNSLFGLWRSAVGPDSAKNDLFENITP